MSSTFSDITQSADMSETSYASLSKLSGKSRSNMQGKAGSFCCSGHSFNKRLVQLIEKHRLLYDSSEEGYTNTQQQDEIWRKLATELNEDVGVVKLKWKNIRSCYTRYLRQISSPHSSSFKSMKMKSYYLAKHLAFLLPFCKPRSYSPGDMLYPAASEQQVETSSDMGVVEKTEPLSDDEDAVELENERILQNMLEDDEQMNFNEANKNWDESSNNLECSSTKVTRYEEMQEEDPEMAFFKSLLPDIRSMNGRQKNKFKIAVLGAIDSILYEEH